MKKDIPTNYMGKGDLFCIIFLFFIWATVKGGHQLENDHLAI